VRWLVCVAAVAIVAVASGRAAAAASERVAVTYSAPVDGPITDPFRPPATPYGAGNRGVDYATRRGEPVHAAAAGDVVFAGAVGNSLHVVVLHADGIRTSYSFLRTVAVARGNRVSAGTPIGTAGESLHFGARAGEAYVDPEVLLAGDVYVHLIPDGTTATALSPPRAESEAIERAHLISAVWGGVKTASRAATQVAVRVSPLTTARHVRVAVDVLRDLRIDGIHRPHVPGEAEISAAIALARRAIDAEPCTPASEPPPPPPPERHLAVMIGGLGSATGSASVLDVDTARLGYAPSDVMQFSYRGGTAAENPYRPADTLVDIRQSGRRLRELLERLQYEHPGVPVDVIAHSQGGLVARAALGDELDPFDPRSPRLGTLITLGTPHHGTDLATAASLLRHTRRGPLIEQVVGRIGRQRGIDPRARSIHQLSETSDFVRELNRRPLPKNVRAVSIAARGDLVVPSPRSHLAGARNVIVSVPTLRDQHARLPGSTAAQREIALALAGRPPSCETLADAAADALTGRAIDRAERAATVAAVGGAEGAP